jgi:D-alanine--poly(phosphoribitol) ligase subunit 1
MYKDESAPFSLRFLAACRVYKDRPAMVIGSAIYSYQTLLELVEGIMRLISARFPAERRIGVADQNDVYTYASILAINLLGKTHVPFNTRYPAIRNKSLSEAASVRVILAAQGFACAGVLVVSDFEAYRNGVADLSVVIRSEEPAYIIFTSGSTGAPKGVPILNKQLNTFFDFFLDKHNYEFTPDDRFLQAYETTFDVSVFSAFLPLFTGACVYLLPRKTFAYLEIPALLASCEITVVSMVPSLLHYLQPYFKELNYPTLRYSFFSGDKLIQELATGWSRCAHNAQIVNCYGPTETTIVCTHYRWQKEQAEQESFLGVVPVGKPFPGIQFMLIDELGKKVALEEEGELCLSGSQVIESYLGNEHADKFFSLTVADRERKYYRTGDRVKCRKDGTLLFIGRTDQQLKIGGYRIEPGEVESALYQLNGNRLCAVLGVHASDGTINLCAFVEGVGEERDLVKKLKTVLPPQCVPSRIVFLKNMPLNANGKIDRQELCNFV